MVTVLYDSGPLDFADEESQCVEINHNLGKCPSVVMIMGEDEDSFPTITGVEGDEVAGPYMTQCSDPDTLKVWKPDVYTYEGKFRIKIF